MQLKLATRLATATIALTLTVGSLLGTTANAAITGSGDVSPANPNTWNGSTDAIIGDPGTGSVTVDGGDTLVCNKGYIGGTGTGAGTVTVTGAGSGWNVAAEVFVGDAGTGVLNIEDGGNVTALDSSQWIIARQPGSTGTIRVAGTDSTLTIESVCTFFLGSGTGTLRIENGGKVVANGELAVPIGSIDWVGGTLEINTSDNKSFTVPNNGLLTGSGTFSSHIPQIVTAGGQSQFTGGPLFTSGGTGYTITGGPGRTLANATYSVQPGGTLENAGLWKLSGGNSALSFVPGGSFSLNTNDVFTTLGDCVGANSLAFGSTYDAAIIINHEVTTSLVVRNGSLLAGSGTFTAGTTQVVNSYGRSQSPGGPLLIGHGSGYTITSGSDYTLANATYNVQPGGAIENDGHWRLDVGDSVTSFVPGGPLALGANDVFTTLDDCRRANDLHFGASTAGVININHTAEIAAYNAASVASLVIGTGGRLRSSITLDTRNASGITINIGAGDFAAYREVADLDSETWIVDPAKVTLNIASPNGDGTVKIADSYGKTAMTTDGTNKIDQADLDSWISEYGDGYTIGYDGFELLLTYTYTPPAPPAPGDSNQEIVEKLIAGGSIVLPPGMTSEDVIASLTATTGSASTSFTAAKTFGTTIVSRTQSRTRAAGWVATRAMPGSNNRLRGQKIMRDFSRGKTSLWMESIGAWATQDVIDETISAYSATLLGMQVGADRMLGRNLLVGISYGGGWATTQSGGQQVLTNIFDLQFYSVWRASQNLRCISSIGYQYSNYAGTFLDAGATHVGNMFKLSGGLEYDIHLNKTLLTPIYGWEYYATEEDAYETGQFSVDGNTTKAIYQRCGVRVELYNHKRLQINLHTSWLHNFGDENIIFSAASGGTPFQLTGAPLHRDLGEVGLGTTIRLTDHLDLTFGYLGVYAPGFNTQSVNGLLRWNF